MLGHGPHRQSLLQQLEADLSAAEASRRDSTEVALRDLAAAMREASHVDEGQGQRIVEGEALALDEALLGDR